MLDDGVIETLLQSKKKQLLIFGSFAEWNSKSISGILKAIDNLKIFTFVPCILVLSQLYRAS